MTITTLHTGRNINQPVFVSPMFDETMGLLLHAKDYFTYHGPVDQRDATLVEKIVYSSEMSRITLRLSCIMAWLLARRAVSNGEITSEEATEQYRLSFHDICLKEMPEMHHVLPRTVCDLLQKSLELYRRASRLDRMIAGETVH